MKLIDGKLVANSIKEEIKKEVANIIDNGLRAPHLVAVIVGNDPASATYIRNKEKACQAVGITSTVYKLEESTTQEKLLEIVDYINKDDEVDGLIVQLPLPKHIDEEVIVNAITPEKDVDGFHPQSIGKMVAGLDTFLPATPYGITKLLEYYNIETSGKHCVVLGRSNIVGTPISILLSRKSDVGNCTVTLCHSRTKNIKELCAQADIIIAAIGKPHFVTEDMVKKDAVVIDVGTNRVKSDKTKSGYALTGDVDFENVAKKCSYITPVPGGVGPMTITSLLLNTLKSYNNRTK